MNSLTRRTSIDGNPYKNYKTPRCFIDSKESDSDSAIIKAFKDFILQDGYPCIGAQTSMNSKSYAIGMFDRMDCWRTPFELGFGLFEYLRQMSIKPSDYYTFIAIFRDDDITSEITFEKSMWHLLQSLRNIDARYHHWSAEVGDNPDSTNFSYSFAEEAFFIVGMHPKSNREARRFIRPAMAFNLHSQFESLRNKNRFLRIKKVIRENDKIFSGSVNPMLADFGKGLEAPQYSGRVVEDDWNCPFKN